MYQARSRRSAPTESIVPPVIINPTFGNLLMLIRFLTLQRLSVRMFRRIVRSAPGSCGRGDRRQERRAAIRHNSSSCARGACAKLRPETLYEGTAHAVAKGSGAEHHILGIYRIYRYILDVSRVVRASLRAAFQLTRTPGIAG